MDVVQILNTIRDNASSEYQARIPEATRTNLEDIRYAMIDDDNIFVANEFTATLINKLVKSVVHSKIFNNPLKSLKKGKKPLGDTVEEIYTNFIKGKQYRADGTELLTRHLPDVKTVYHRMNYQMKYPITISRQALSKAFVSEESLEKFITNIINSLYNSAELDEFANIKNIIKSAIEKKAVKFVTVADPTSSEANAKKFIKDVKTVSGMMQFPSTQWNGYLSAQDTDTNPITTFTRKDEQVLILDTETDTTVSVDVLASIFNMSVAEFNDTKKIVIDAFPKATVDGSTYTTRALLIDEAFIQMYDDLFTVGSFRNDDGLYESYFLHVWQTQAFSILVNAVGFGTKATA